MVANEIGFIDKLRAIPTHTRSEAKYIRNLSEYEHLGDRPALVRIVGRAAFVGASVVAALILDWDYSLISTAHQVKQERQGTEL